MAEGDAGPFTLQEAVEGFASLHDEDLISDLLDEVEILESRQIYRDWLRECGEIKGGP